MRAAALLLIAVLLLPIHAKAAPRPSVARACPQKAATVAGVRSLIQCAAPRLGVSTSKAMYIAWHESRYEPWVCNSSDHCGTYQIYRPLWSHMVGRYVYGRSLGVLSRTNGRANVMLSLRFMRHEGFWPWGG